MYLWHDMTIWRNEEENFFDLCVVNVSQKLLKVYRTSRLISHFTFISIIITYDSINSFEWKVRDVIWFFMWYCSYENKIMSEPQNWEVRYLSEKFQTIKNRARKKCKIIWNEIKFLTFWLICHFTSLQFRRFFLRWFLWQTGR